MRLASKVDPLARLTLSVGLAGLADGVTKVAAPLYVVQLSGDPRLVAGAAVAVAIPWLLFGLASGAVTDRMRRHHGLRLGNLIRAAALVGIAAGAVLGDLRIPVLYVLLMALGTGETLAENAAQAMVPELVDRAALDRANGRLFATTAMSQQVGGQGLGGILFAVAAAVPFVSSVALFAAAALLAAVIPARDSWPDGRPARDTHILRDMADGLAWLWRHRLLRTLAVVGGVANFLFGGVFAVLVLLARQRLGLGPAGYGVLLATGAAGALLGSLLTSRLVSLLGRRRILAGWVLVQAAIWALVAFARWPAAVALLLAAGWFTAAIASVATTSLRQDLVPEHLLGRVTSVFRMLSWGTVPFGALCAGFVAAAAGVTAPYWLAAVLLALTGALAAPVVLRAEPGAIGEPTAEQAPR